MEKSKAIFFDRDGVLNKDFANHAYDKSTFLVLPGVPQAIQKLKKLGYLLIIVTNQSGIIKGLYKKENVMWCHRQLERACKVRFDDLYYAPLHEFYSNSLARKPGRLMFERALAKYNIDLDKSYMIGDKERDIIPAKQVGVKNLVGIGIKNNIPSALWHFSSLEAATDWLAST